MASEVMDLERKLTATIYWANIIPNYILSIYLYTHR